ncbi:MAG: hypothetical protein HQM12_23390 [SAR324 cluster bacterium]|nr:hypothetical protein [SAR324 cluster bacterium]
MLIFDTLAFAERLEKVNFSHEQAKVLTEELKNILDDNVATKLDIQEVKREIQEVKRELKLDIKELENRMETRFKEMDNKMETRLKELEMRMTIRLGSLMVVAVGAMATLVKLL